MSRIREHGRITAWPLLFAFAFLFAGSLTSHAQYVGHVDTSQNSNKPTLRATAVLEYTGDLSKPNASRLIPIAVWDGERYEPGSLYLAEPVPLTVQTGTQYVLQVAGTPKGLFDVKAASDVGGSWIAIGNYQKPTPPSYAKLPRSRHMPSVISDADNDKPHFAHVPTGDTNPGSGTTKTTASNAGQASSPDIDSEQPTLHRRTGNDNSQTTSSDSSAASNSAPPIDPDRPILSEPPKSAPNTNNLPGSMSGGEPPETATSATDPNRPHLEYGRPENPESLDAETKAEIATIASHPENLEQIVAISDAVNRPVHSYVYSWNSPDDETKMQSALETAAQQILAKSAENVTKKAAKSSVPRRTAPHTTHRKASPPLPALTDEQFKAYALSWGSGPTLVFSATSGEGDAARYITLIAQPDFNGTPLILFKQVTSERELSIIPRMKLIDAVDTDADNRAELIFALENQTGRQYAIYRVANNQVEQVFSTGS